MATAESGAELYRIDDRALLPRNVAPLLANDSLTVVTGNSGTVALLSNDSDPDGQMDPASVTVVRTASHGTVTISATGSATYTPNAGFTGSDSFEYSVRDREGLAAAAAATVAITVNAQPSPPPPASRSKGALDWLSAMLLSALSIAATYRRRPPARTD
jgi:Bacterial Ig domain